MFGQESDSVNIMKSVVMTWFLSLTGALAQGLVFEIRTVELAGQMPSGDTFRFEIGLASPSTSPQYHYLFDSVTFLTSDIGVVDSYTPPGGTPIINQPGKRITLFPGDDADFEAVNAIFKEEKSLIRYRYNGQMIDPLWGSSEIDNSIGTWRIERVNTVTAEFRRIETTQVVAYFTFDVTPVPEPSTWILGLLGTAVLGVTKLRRWTSRSSTERGTVWSQRHVTLNVSRDLTTSETHSDE